MNFNNRCYIFYIITGCSDKNNQRQKYIFHKKRWISVILAPKRFKIETEKRLESLNWFDYKKTITLSKFWHFFVFIFQIISKLDKTLNFYLKPFRKINNNFSLLLFWQVYNFMDIYISITCLIGILRSIVTILFGPKLIYLYLLTYLKKKTCTNPWRHVQSSRKIKTGLCRSTKSYDLKIIWLRDTDFVHNPYSFCRQSQKMIYCICGIFHFPGDVLVYISPKNEKIYILELNYIISISYSLR